MESIPDKRVQTTVTAYFAAIGRRDFKAWKALFAAETVVHDPIDAPPVLGREAVEETWKMLTVPFQTLHLEAEAVYYSRAGAAAKWTGQGKGVDSGSVVFEGITIFEMDDEGLIETLMAYWDPAAMLIRLAGEAD